MPINKETLQQLYLKSGKPNHLDLGKQNLTDNDIELVCAYLLDNPQITSLDLFENQIGAAGALALAANKTITSLNLRLNQIDAAAAKALATSNTITSLDVSYNKIGTLGAQALAENKTITSLNVSYNIRYDEVEILGLQALQKIRQLLL